MFGKEFQRKYALTDQGIKNTKQATLWTVIVNLVVMGGMGILYLIFCWTGIPAVIGFIEGIIYLCSNSENFQLKNHVRIG